MAVRFKYKKTLYTKQAIKDSGIMSQEQLRDEYSRLARLKNSRLTRLERAFPRADILKESDRAPKWGELLDKNGNPNMTKLSNEMSQAYKFLTKDTTTVSGYRRQLKRSIKSFNKLFDKGEKPINEENIFDLYDFLEDYRQRSNSQRIPDSDRVIDIFAEAERLNISSESLKENVNYWREHYSEMKNLDPINSDNPVSSNAYKELLQRK